MVECLLAVLDFIGLHLLEDRPGTLVLLWYLAEVFIKMALDLFLGFGNDTQAPFVSGNAGYCTQRKGTCIPEGVQ